VSGRRIGLVTIALRSLRHHAAATAITAAAAALGCGLVISVVAIERQARAAFQMTDSGIDAVLGARGSKLQLVLNALFHLDTSPGNVPWSEYEKVRADPDVAVAVPYAVGDSYRGFRVVGTTGEAFTKLEFRRGQTLRLEPDPRAHFFDPERREAVIGSFVAAQTGLRIDDVFQPAHNLVADDHEKPHDEHYTVVGILAPTNTPVDRVVFIPLEGMYRMGGHALRGAGREYVARDDQEIPDSDKEVSAVLLQFRDPGAGFRMDQAINRQGRQATLAWPIATATAEIFDRLGWMTGVLRLVAILVAVVAAASISASVCNTIRERRREFAILRSLGARKATVVRIVVLESAATAALGAAGGVVVHFAVFAVAASIVRAQTGVVLDVLAFDETLVSAPLGMVLLGALAGLVPARQAYATEVAENLAPSS
jgi:putative ABC transport system permease protein